MSMALLVASQVVKRFGGLTAVDKVDFIIETGSIVSIIGPNGAGKTTFFNCITGIYRPEQGEIQFAGHSLVGRRPDQVTAMGIARTFQNIRLFANMTVLENVLVGMHAHMRTRLWEILLRRPAFRQEDGAARKQAREILEFVGLTGSGDVLAKNLPYGAQRRVEVARALATQPKLLLLDEPTAGMNPQESRDAITLFRRLRDTLGVTVLLIEHQMRVVMDISERITVLDYGARIAEGTPKEISQNPTVIEAYLGRGAASHIRTEHTAG
jgi:branched-chain amino acid transport system ATP-binding protein